MLEDFQRDDFQRYFLFGGGIDMDCLIYLLSCLFDVSWFIDVIDFYAQCKVHDELWDGFKLMCSLLPFYHISFDSETCRLFFELNTTV